MEKGVSSKTRFVLNYIGKDTESEIDDYINKFLEQDYYEFTSREDIQDKLGSFIDKYLSKINYEDTEILRSYTGLLFRRLNQVLRGY